MTSAAVSRSVGLGLLRQPIGCAWRAWRALSRRHFYYAALAGFGFGLVHGTGVAMTQRSFWGTDAIPQFVSALSQAVLLLLCLSVATNVRVRRGPRWVPFVIAATVATVILGVSDYVVLLSWNGKVSSFIPPLMNSVASLFTSLLVALGYMYGFDAVRRTDALRNLQVERTRIARQAYEARLKALQARVEPRFLFDTLAAIEAAYATSPESGECLIDNLIVYLRAALPTMEQSTSSVSVELTLVRAWLEIMRMRRGVGLTFSIATPSLARDVKIPPMILLPLVQHAVDCARDRVQCELKVSVSADDRQVHIVVTASGPECELPVETPATMAIHERLHTIYGANASLRFINTDRNEYRANMEIPT